MCGIAGFSLAHHAQLDRTAVARILLAGIAERGQDATGYAYRHSDGSVRVHKESKQLARLIDRIAIPDDASEAILHVREFTKGIPGLNDNNHPVRWGGVVGVHNGHLDNDDELFAAYGRERSTPTISVDSEAIMMLTEVLGDLGAALEQVRGSAAVAVLRDDDPGRVTLAKRTRRPIVVGRTDGIVLFASTRAPLELAARAAGLRLRYEELGDGTLLELREGEIAERRRFAVDYRYAGRRIPEYPRLPEHDRLVRIALAAFGVG